MKGAGLLDSNLPPGFTVPEPNDSVTLREDEDPLEDEEGEPAQGDLLETLEDGEGEAADDKPEPKALAKAAKAG